MSGTCEPLVARGPGPDEGDRADRAILRTLAYAALFQSALTLEQLHRRLMEVPLAAGEIRARLDGAFLRSRAARTGDRVHLAGGEDWTALGEERRRRTRALVDAHRPLLRALARFPFVRLVALSGACAHDNATDSDVDVFLVVRRGRAWLVTLASMVMARAVGRRRSLCVNYVVDEGALALPEHDLFTAAEVVGLRPLAGARAYEAFVAANAWVEGLFPNFFLARSAPAGVPEEAGAPRWLERLLDLGLAPTLETLARRGLGAWFRRKWGGAREGVRLAPGRLKLHPVDHGPPLRAAFEEIVRRVDGDDA